ncbi:hypothetical protein AAE478_000124 [Parahypoxylon ruwenzoriense]
MPAPSLPPNLVLRGSPASSPRGRSVAAARTLRPGSTIAIFDDGPAVVAIPDTPHLGETCSYCLRVAAADPADVHLRACTGCRTSSYCSRACQKADWRLVHGRGECAAFQEVRRSGDSAAAITRVLPTPVRALLQVMLRPEALAGLADVEGHVERVRTADPDTWAGLELQARAALHYAGREMSTQSVAEAVEILCKLQVNSFNLLDVDVGQSGNYINPALAMVNHSCVPNAFVQFIGRKATLHAFREIKEGEEIEISYIECTLHRSQRQQALKSRYYFDCVCPRCKDDLDIYQVCQKYPHPELNSFSLVPDFGRLQHPPIKESLNSNKLLQRRVEEIYPVCSGSLQGLSLVEKSKQLGQRWKMCAPLRKAELYAIEPLHQVFVEAGVYFSEQNNFAYGLAISCFIALNSDPYRGPMPFDGQRVKGMLMIAKLLTHTASAASTVPSGSGVALATRISRALSKMDQVTMCQIALTMVIRYSPEAHSKEWQVYIQARDLLNELEGLPGRERENTMVYAISRNPNSPDEKPFFETVVLDPIRTLAQFALEVMDTEFGS